MGISTVGLQFRRPLVVALLVATMVMVGTTVDAVDHDAAGEVNVVDEQFQSQIWTGLCGFPVWRHNYGSERIWEEPQGGGGIIFRGVFQLTITLTGIESGNTYTFRDRGTDRERLLRDGSDEYTIIGRSFPANTIGRQILIDGEVVRLSGRTAYDPDAICQTLAP